MDSHKAETLALFGLPIANVSSSEAIAKIEQLILSGSSHQVATANLDFARNALRDPYLHRIICDCSLVVPDGAPIIWASKLLRKPLQERVTGVDLVPKIAQLSAERGYGVYLLGSSDANAERAVEVLRESYPNMNIVGRYSPPIRPLDEMDNEEIISRIRGAKPDILLVGFGNPKQEIWIHRHLSQLNVPVAIGIGGSLDMIAGSLLRAPRWMQRMDMEWVFRMVQEPGRLFPRYAKDVTVLLRHLPMELMAAAIQPKTVRRGELSVVERSGARVISLGANLSANLCAELHREAKASARSSQSLVVDLTQTTRIEVDGLGSLLEARRVMQSAGKSMWLAGMNASLKRAFQLSSLSDMIPIANTPLQAVRVARHSERGPWLAAPAGMAFATTVDAQGLGWQAFSTRRSLVDHLYNDYGTSGVFDVWRRSIQVAFRKRNWALSINVAQFMKRAMDIVVSAIALLVLFPFFLVIALIIHLEGGGPVLFWQTRTGLWGKEFNFPKFRSMVVDAEKQKVDLLAANHHGSGITFKMRRDPRVTKVGAVIRKLSIDELPQLWCVLRGDMSLVGPRPPMPNEVARYAVRDRLRLEVKPGLTCIWQVSGRGEIAFDQQVILDEEYINNHSLLLDLKLLFKTIPVILTGHGAF